MPSIQRLQSVLWEIQQACAQLSLPQPVAVFDSTEETPLLMGSLANLAGVLVSDSFKWEHLQKTYIVTGDGSTTEFDLPTDFSSVIDNTGWSYVIRRPVVVLNAQQWAAISSWLSQSFFVNPACRILNNKMQFMSAPPVGQIKFQYQSVMWATDGDDGTDKQILTKNSDIPKFDWLMMVLAIKCKWMEQKGMDTTAVMSDLADRYNQLTSKDLVAPTLTLSGPIPGGFRYLDNFYNTPDTNIGL